MIGGHSLAAHGFNRFSEDLDLVVDRAPANTAWWIRAPSRLPDGGGRPRCR